MLVSGLTPISSGQVSNHQILLPQLALIGPFIPSLNPKRPAVEGTQRINWLLSSRGGFYRSRLKCTAIGKIAGPRALDVSHD